MYYKRRRIYYGNHKLNFTTMLQCWDEDKGYEIVEGDEI